MKHFTSYITIIFLSVALILSGCSDDEAAKDKKNNETGEKQNKPEKPEVSEAATEPEAMVKEGPGNAFTSEKIGPEKLKKTVESLPEDLTADEAYNHLIHLFAADYRPALKKYETFNPSFIVDDAPKGDNDSNKKEKDKELHIALLMDASGSMGAQVNGEMKMKSAKGSLKKFVSDLPDSAKVMLRVYGHKGTGSDADKKMSCSSTEIVYPFSTYKKAKFEKALSQFKPAGWTPLAASIKAAKKDLKSHSGDNVKNIVYIISDGEETCGGDPVKAAKKLHESGIATAVNIIGFDVGNKAQAQLKKVAKAGGGSFTNVDSGKDIYEAAQDNISEAVEAAELNMWSALEGVDLTWDAIHKNDDLDVIASNFDDVTSQEYDLLSSGLIGLVETKKITEKEADEVEDLLETRQEKIEQFNEKKEERLEKQIEKEKEKASDLIDKMKKEQAKD